MKFVNVLDCQSESRDRGGVKARAEICVNFSAPPKPPANSAMTSTPIVRCSWIDEMARERTSHQPAFAEAFKTKSLTLRA